MNPHLYWIEQYRRYLAALDTSTTQWDAAIPLSQEDRQALRSDPFKELDFDVGIEELEEATDIFPNLLRRSAFLLLFTLFERSLTHVGEEAQRRSQNPIHIQELKGNGFQQVVRYLTLIGPIRCQDLPEWPEIVQFQRLRNAFAHRNGIIGRAGRDLDLVAYVQRAPALGIVELPDGFLVQVASGFCEHAVSTIERVLSAVPRTAWGKVV